MKFNRQLCSVYSFPFFFLPIANNYSIWQWKSAQTRQGTRTSKDLGKDIVINRDGERIKIWPLLLMIFLKYFICSPHHRKQPWIINIIFLVFQSCACRCLRHQTLNYSDAASHLILQVITASHICSNLFTPFVFYCTLIKPSPDYKAMVLYSIGYKDRGHRLILLIDLNWLYFLRCPSDNNNFIFYRRQ